MPITAGEWESIRSLVLQVAGQKRGEAFVLGKVVKTDVNRGHVYLAEFGDQPIPMLHFEYEVKYYDTRNDGKVLDTSGLLQARASKEGAVGAGSVRMGYAAASSLPWNSSAQAYLGNHRG